MRFARNCIISMSGQLSTLGHVWPLRRVVLLLHPSFTRFQGLASPPTPAGLPATDAGTRAIGGRRAAAAGDGALPGGEVLLVRVEEVHLRGWGGACNRNT